MLASVAWPSITGATDYATWTISAVRRVNLYLSSTVNKNPSHLYPVCRGLGRVARQDQGWWSHHKNRLAAHQMALSATSTHVSCFNSSNTNGSKNVKKKKSVRSILLLVCQLRLSPPYYTSAYDMDMRKVIDSHAAATEHVDQGLSPTLLCSDIPKGSTNGKRKQRHVNSATFLSRTMPSPAGIAIYYVRTFTDDGEVKYNQCESVI